MTLVPGTDGNHPTGTFPLPWLHWHDDQWLLAIPRCGPLHSLAARLQAETEKRRRAAVEYRDEHQQTTSRHWVGDDSSTPRSSLGCIVQDNTHAWPAYRYTPAKEAGTVIVVVGQLNDGRGFDRWHSTNRRGTREKNLKGASFCRCPQRRWWMRCSVDIVGGDRLHPRIRNPPELLPPQRFLDSSANARPVLGSRSLSVMSIQSVINDLEPELLSLGSWRATTRQYRFLLRAIRLVATVNA